MGYLRVIRPSGTQQCPDDFDPTDESVGYGHDAPPGQSFVPVGTIDHSPLIHRWDDRGGK
jgi:hypothetical protein